MKMKCRYEKKLALYQLEALPAAEQQRVREHLEGCPACRDSLRALERTAELLSSRPLQDAPPEVWAGIQARLEPRRKTRRVALWSSRPALVVAALLLVAVAATLLVPVLHPTGLSVAPPQIIMTPLVANNGALDTTVQAQISAAWDNPLADKAALGLAVISLETSGGGQEAVN